MSEKLKILFVTSEADPFVKTGGLADVSGSLPQILREEGHDVRVVLPEYLNMDEKFKLELEHVTVFNRAVLEMLPEIDFKPDIIHFNDWQTGILALLLDDNYRKYDFYEDIKTLYTIHNLRYQGQFDPKIIGDVLGINYWHWNSGNIRHNGLVNFMKAGIFYADKINTVSETYAEEIKTSYFGEGLDYALRMRSRDLKGIVNGISYDKFNPKTDSDIYYNYDQDDLETKLKNKEKLQKEFELPVNKEIHLIGIVTRLVEQKGIDLIKAILEEAINKEDMQ